jgi:hypothetical protein
VLHGPLVFLKRPAMVFSHREPEGLSDPLLQSALATLAARDIGGIFPGGL